MSASTSAKKNKKKSKINPNRPEEPSQQTQIINQSLTTAAPSLQLGNAYDQHFPSLGTSTPSQTSRNSSQPFDMTSSNVFKQTEPTNNGATKDTSSQPVKMVDPSTTFSNSYWQPLNMSLGNYTYGSFIPNIAMTPLRSNIIVQNSLPPQPKFIYEQDVARKLSEIILTIHARREFVSRERVQSELFHYFGVDSWQQLGVRSDRLGPLVNLTDRLKKVTFYMQIFEQVFMLCTLHELGLLLAKFLNVNTYEDAHLGPLTENPDVKRVFRYEPTQRHQPIPVITSGDIISLFINFHTRSKRNLDFGEFLDELVSYYRLRTRSELGLYCKSFPFLLQVSTNVQRNYLWHIDEIQRKTIQDLTNIMTERLSQLKQEVQGELDLSSYNKKKSPIAVFNHLISIVEKYLSFIPEQSMVYVTLTHFRQNELLQLLLNISIYLGTIETPDVFIAELDRICRQQSTQLRLQILTQFYQWLPYDPAISGMDYGRLQTMIQQPLNVLIASQNLSTTNVSSFPTVHPSLTNPLPPTNRNKPKLSVTLKEFCSYLFEILINYEIPLTVKQFLQIENHLCTKYNVSSFAAFKFDENENDNADINLVSFLHSYQTLIDPNSELSIYKYNAPVMDQQELFEFVNQIIESNSDRQHRFSQTLQFGTYANDDENIPISDNNLSIIEKVINHKFSERFGYQSGTNILRKAKQSRIKSTYSIIRFEETLLDFNYLERINTCPSMPITNENELCQFVLQCPTMINLYTWLQWTHFFEPYYGNLKSFIKKHQYSLQDLLLLETSTHELLRLPINANLKSFADELNSLHVRSAVGHLCALITCDHGLITRIPLNVYRPSMRSWFLHLQSLSMVQGHDQEPMKHILDFLTYLPMLLGQARLIQELILGPLDDVFRPSGVNTVSARTRLWQLADEKQKNKLEIWGHMLDINDWKNNNKWSGQQYAVEDSLSFVEPSASRSILNETTAQENTHIPSVPISTAPVVTSSISNEIKNNNENESIPQAAFEHIESIRRGLGVDSGLDSNGQSIVNNLQGMIERSLQKLSKDLYSEQGHFVLELIQNADDNHYPSNCLPTLRFVLSDKRILVCNNEIGFQPNNVAAICNVGTTTKGKHKQGYAGHKGIGFKSVFMVSNRPEIHSCNYHFCFDTVDGTQQIGFIRPIWLNECEEILPNVDEWTTCIRLPIQRNNRLQENFENIQAKLLLFLNRLRRIEIVGQVTSSVNSDQTRTFTRIDHADGKIIELQEKTINGTINKTFWLVIKRVIEVPEDIKDKLGEVKCDVHSTTIAIAYPLSSLQKLSQQLPSTQPLFAYLPLRSYGFRFILQADFEIPVTRQEILHDNIWNEWLKSEMVQLLPLAYTHFQSLPDLLTSSLSQLEIGNQLTTAQVLIYFLKLIPTRNELDPYFNSFVDKSMKLLMGIIKLPVPVQDSKGQAHIEWVPTSQCVLVKDPFIRKILPQELLMSHFNMYYVPEEVAAECNERTLIKLGCAPLQFSSIIRLIKELYKQREQEHSTKTSSIEQIAQWFLCIDYILQQQQEGEQRHGGYNERIESTTLAELKQLKIIPLSGHSRLVSIDEFNDEVILFPLSKTAQYKKPFKIILEDLPRLDERLLEYIEDKFPRRYETIECLFKKLGMMDNPKIKDIYRLHIKPTLLDPTRWSKKSDSVLVAYLLCIYAYADQFENELDQLQKHMVIKTRNGEFVRLDAPGLIIHLTSTYGCTKSLESLISSKHTFTFISDDYYNNYRTELFRTNDELKSFVRFLGQLNITEFFQMKITDTHFINVSQLQSTHWAYLIPELSKTIHQPFVIDDCCCDEFNTLVTPSTNNTSDIDLYRKLLSYLDRHHESFSSYYTASIILTDEVKSGRRRAVKNIPSTFCLSLRQHAWLPIEGGKLAKPDDVYCLHPKSETLYFRRYVSHLDRTNLSLNNRDFLLNILGLKEHVLPMTMFEIFIQWSCGFDRDSLWTLLEQTTTMDIIPCTLPPTFRQSCSDTIDNIRRIYHFLIADNNIFNILSCFRCWPLVFIPRDSSRGDFVFAHQVYWHDPTLLLTSLNHRSSIQQYYGNDATLQKFFLDILQIPSEPTIDDYFPLLTQLPNINDIWRLIEIIVRLTFQQNRQVEVKERCFDVPFIPCMGKKNKRVKYTDQPFYPHDPDIANSLAERLSIIQLPDWTLPYELKNHFCSLFDIRSLADVIQLQVHVDNEQLSKDLFNFFSHSMELIQHFLLTNSLITEERSKYLASIFARMHFVGVDQIQISYHYELDTLTAETYDTYVDEREGRFYILKKFEKSEIRYIETMARYLVQDRATISKLISFMMELSQIYQNQGEQGLIKRRESIVIQEHGSRWILPNVYSIASAPPSKQIPVDDQPIHISAEMTEQLMNEPLPERKPPARIPTEKDDKKNLICFPAKAGMIESDKSTDTKSHSIEQKQRSVSSNVSNFNHSSSSRTISQIVEESDNNCKTKDHETAKSTRKIRSNAATIDCSNSTPVEVTKFQNIRVSILTGSNLYPLSSIPITINPTGNAVDNTTGRQGEEVVFRFLQMKHPNEHVEWMNAKQESGLPYDIRIKKNNQLELIEVKTTRTHDQHTFQISIEEIECLRANPKNYHIYRVYYSDDPNSIKITIIPEVSSHLEQKQLALCMTIMQQADEQTVEIK